MYKFKDIIEEVEERNADLMQLEEASNKELKALFEKLGYNL